MNKTVLHSSDAFAFQRGEKLRLYDEDRTIVESTRTYAQYAKYPLKTGLLMEMLG